MRDVKVSFPGLSVLRRMGAALFGNVLLSRVDSANIISDVKDFNKFPITHKDLATRTVPLFPCGPYYQYSLAEQIWKTNLDRRFSNIDNCFFFFIKKMKILAWSI